jgi:hypothetical protein
MLGLLPPNIYFVNFEEENIDVNVYLPIIQTFKNLIPKHIETSSSSLCTKQIGRSVDQLANWKGGLLI